MNVPQLLKEFWDYRVDKEIDIYNEFSLQHELGIYLRNNCSDYVVQFERNAKSFFGIDETVKHEIDIVIFKRDMSGFSEKYAIELKFPTNKQYPEQMFSFIKDISFMEQLKQGGFTGCYVMTLANDKNFYTGKKRDGIYRFFRAGETIEGHIQKPTGEKDLDLDIHGQYKIEWQPLSNREYYYLIEI